ncbi:MAG: signal peptidase I [Chloroflexi bacterium]|nr:signal peptidase I [Chloroflexota bacterium]
MKIAVPLVGYSLLLLATGLVYLVVIFPRTTNTQLMVVRSGSMAPTFLTGDAIIVRQPDGYFAPEMIVTFAEGNRLITHRIVEVNEVDGSTQLVTQGDANSAPDAMPVSPEQVRGIYTHRIPYLGYLAEGVRRPMVWLVVLVLPAVLLVALEVWNPFKASGPAEAGRRPGKASTDLKRYA